MVELKPIMGWNAWNTFGCNVSESLIMEIADVMVNEGYKDAGYKYVCIDDGWALRNRDKNGKLVPDPEKFPNGMKTLSDYVHSKGLKLGIYSCAGVLTCAGYPGSYGHEYSDAEQFNDWGIDLLKYDFCNFPESANSRISYLTMSMALRAMDRDILFSACNWGYENPENWMNEIGAHMYRTDTDIRDTYVSFRDIALNHISNMKHNTSSCFPDIDMLTVGMYGNGFISRKNSDIEISDELKDEMYNEYVTQFLYWCFVGAPLIIGADIRAVDERCKKLLCNKELIKINRDSECRPPALVYGYKYHLPDAKDEYIMIRILENDEIAIGFFNFKDTKSNMRFVFADSGIPFSSGYGVEIKDVLSGEDIGLVQDCFEVTIPAHGGRVFRGRIKKNTDSNAQICKSLNIY